MLYKVFIGKRARRKAPPSDYVNGREGTIIAVDGEKFRILWDKRGPSENQSKPLNLKTWVDLNRFHIIDDPA